MKVFKTQLEPDQIVLTLDDMLMLLKGGELYNDESLVVSVSPLSHCEDGKIETKLNDVIEYLKTIQLHYCNPQIHALHEVRDLSLLIKAHEIK